MATQAFYRQPLSVPLLLFVMHGAAVSTWTAKRLPYRVMIVALSVGDYIQTSGKCQMCVHESNKCYERASKS